MCNYTFRQNFESVVRTFLLLILIVQSKIIDNEIIQLFI
jgi:hypothetical protein